MIPADNENPVDLHFLIERLRDRRYIVAFSEER